MSTRQSDAIAVSFDKTKCIHARRCVLGLPEVFKPGTKGGWIFPENADADALADVVAACPSGALTYERLDGGAPERTPQTNTARLWENGPVEVRGDVRVGDDPPATRALLCRCGQSKNKPYCDNSHIGAGFAATGEPAAKDPGEAGTGGPLSVTGLPNGPLKVAGACEVIAGSGRQVAKGESAFLCRCGASGSKPFCDGSHSKIGFEAP